MAKPHNPNNTSTTVMIPKELKNRIRCYALPSVKRSGFESDAQILERLISWVEESFPLDKHEAKLKLTYPAQQKD